ncbi:MAG: isoamylase early set domain-containing protein [Deltaproteobacteria bacterium]
MVKAVRIKPVEFKLYAPSAKKVALAGSFNNWDIKAHPAKKDSQGNWTIKINLKTGRHEYKFFADGSWINDPSCNSCVANSFGSQNCVVDVR